MEKDRSGKNLPTVSPAPDCIQPKTRGKRILQLKVTGLPIPTGITFTYYGRPSSITGRARGARGHNGVITVAMKIVGPGLLHLGLAFCSPEDAWCKVRGRDLAIKRLYDDPIVLPFLYEPRRMVRQAVLALASREFKKLSQLGALMPPKIEHLVPGWAKGMVKIKKTIGLKRGAIWINEAAAIPRHAYDAIQYLMSFSPRQFILHQPGGPRSILSRMLADIAKLERK